MSEDEFVEAVTQGQSRRPAVLRVRRRLEPPRTRVARRPPRDAPARRRPRRCSHQAEGAVVIDGRPADVFASGHLRGSINVGLDGRFAEYAGDILRPGQEVIVVTEPGTRERGADPSGADRLRPRDRRSRRHRPRCSSTTPNLAEQAARVTASELDGLAVAPLPICRSSMSATPARCADRRDRRLGQPPAAEPARPDRGTRSRPSDHRLLRGRIPLGDRRITLAIPRLHHGRRHLRRVRRGTPTDSRSGDPGVSSR